VFPLPHIHECDKLSPRIVKYIFIGYQCYDPINRRLHIAYYVTFFENISYYAGLPYSDLSFLQPSSPPSASAPQPTLYIYYFPIIIPSSITLRAYVSSPSQDSIPDVPSPSMNAPFIEVSSTIVPSSGVLLFLVAILRKIANLLPCIDLA